MSCGFITRATPVNDLVDQQTYTLYLIERTKVLDPDFDELAAMFGDGSVREMEGMLQAQLNAVDGAN